MAVPELISQQADVLLKYGGVSREQYEEVRRRLTRPNSAGVNWFCQEAHITWIEGILAVRFTLNEQSSTEEVKDVIERAFKDIDFVKGTTS